MWALASPSPDVANAIAAKPIASAPVTATPDPNALPKSISASKIDPQTSRHLKTFVRLTMKDELSTGRFA